MQGEGEARHPAREARMANSSDGFVQGAVHSVTHTVPRGGLRERLVPWTLAVVMTVGIAVAGVGFALEAYWLMASVLAVVAALAVFGATQHSWRASTRYKYPLSAPVAPGTLPAENMPRAEPAPLERPVPKAGTAGVLRPGANARSGSRRQHQGAHRGSHRGRGMRSARTSSEEGTLRAVSRHALAAVDAPARWKRHRSGA